MMKNELKVENLNNLLNVSDLLEKENMPSINEQEKS